MQQKLTNKTSWESVSIWRHETRNQQIPSREPAGKWKAVGPFSLHLQNWMTSHPPNSYPSPHSPFFFPLFIHHVSSRGKEDVPILGTAHLLKGERISCARPARGAGRLIINPSSYIPWLTTKGAVQIDPTKLSVLISQPLLNAVPLSASTWQGMLSHHIPAAPPTPSPVPTLLFSFSQVVTAQASQKESNRDRSYCSAKRQEKK